MTKKPGADELQIRRILLDRGVGPDAEPTAAAAEPAPAEDPDGWWDELYADEQLPAGQRRRAPRIPDWWSKKTADLTTDQANDEPTEDEGEPETSTDPDPEPAEETGPEDDAAPDRWAPQPEYWPRPHVPAALTHARPAFSARTRRLLYNASAAGAGWALGLYGVFAGAIDDCGTRYSTSGAIVLGVAGCLAIAHMWDRRTRHWWIGIAWAARIPLATAITALALWAPGA